MVAMVGLHLARFRFHVAVLQSGLCPTSSGCICCGGDCGAALAQVAPQQEHGQAKDEEACEWGGGSEGVESE